MSINVDKTMWKIPPEVKAEKKKKHIVIKKRKKSQQYNINATGETARAIVSRHTTRRTDGRTRLA